MKTEVEQVFKSIGSEHLEIKQAMLIVLMHNSEHITSEIIDEVNKVKEYVQRGVEEVKKLYQYFHLKLNMPIYSA